MTTRQLRPDLGFWEKVDVPFVHLSVYASMLYHVVAGVFRGKASPRRYDHFIATNVIRKLVSRTTDRQKQYMNAPTPDAYTTAMASHGVQPERVALPHGAEGLWLGNKNAKKVVIYYHGGGFAMPAIPGHFKFWLEMIRALNEGGHDVAVFFLHYTLTPHARYPTQLRQAVEALRYIVNETGRSPADVVIGGDSAGGNLTSATILHLSHPHPEIDPLPLSAPLAGSFAYAPWTNFSNAGPSMKENAWKDIITPELLDTWSSAYKGDKPADNWNEPFNAPAEWWKDAKTEHILVVAGGDEILLSSIEQLAEKIKSVFPATTFIIGEDESHDSIYFVSANESTKTGTELRQWIASRL
ncbi:unnamed protein product [Penicillium olsonii]|uniref:Alpha/beta hydrolase fold-3 domain-containing protein n=1 Tax=Penicillium olsonii TaxID=99116 RepID=A0A9W4HDQ9_PENOL|nr:unnamed protein product [Penicillium olsonii]CAG7996090.1 unnamed protein product [Penicillium olsonii]CAG8147661.1 unnamed protein product [Penicillium olsonii]CAG8148365.1 unnamed protein product [Penicillium olsonii]